MQIEIKVFNKETNVVLRREFHDVSSLYEGEALARSFGAGGAKSVSLSPPRVPWATDLVVWAWPDGDKEVHMICDFPIVR